MVLFSCFATYKIRDQSCLLPPRYCPNQTQCDAGKKNHLCISYFKAGLLSFIINWLSTCPESPQLRSNGRNRHVACQKQILLRCGAYWPDTVLLQAFIEVFYPNIPQYFALNVLVVPQVSKSRMRGKSFRYHAHFNDNQIFRLEI